jgi:hypothetical protein
MQRYADERMIKRNGTLGKVLTFGGLGVMVLGLVISVSQPQQANLVLAMALVGVLASQLGLAFYTRWGRRPRMDEILDEALKGLDGRYALFHYSLGTSHLLVTPAGLFAVTPRLEEGEITYQDGAWTQHRERAGVRRRPGTRALKGVEQSARVEADAAAQALRRRLGEADAIPVQPLLVFMHPRATLRAKDTPIPAYHAKKIKEGLRAMPKAATLGEAQMKGLAVALHLTAGEEA